MPTNREPAKEFRAHRPAASKLSYAEKLKSPRWQKKRLHIFNRAGWRCEECGATEEQLSIHHCLYLSLVEPYDHPDDILLSLCSYCHKTRQAVEQAFLLEVARYMARLSIGEIKNQPGWTFFVDESALESCFPAWQHEWLRHERDRD